MTFQRAHVVGAGLAGLAAATRLASSGIGVTLHEAAQQAGGRCRSYVDADLERRIDNGNHLLVSGNDCAMAYIAAIGSAATFHAGERAAFSFFDLASGEQWSLRPNDGRIPWWMLVPERGVAGARPWDFLELLRLGRADEASTVAAILDPASQLYRRLWQPLCVAALNTEPEAASASLLKSVMQRTFGRGGAGLRPLLPRIGLSESLVDPALSLLAQRNAQVRFGARLKAIGFEGSRVTSLSVQQQEIGIAPEEAVILAVPASMAAELVPSLHAPDEFRAIVNAHFRHEAQGLDHSFIGIIGGDVDWVFAKPGILSTTTSAAQRIVDVPAEELGPRLWREVAKARNLPESPTPSHRILKEKRATFAATPAQQRRRPPAQTPWSNLFLAGDWTQTGWPATIEGAIFSGFKAASLIAGNQGAWALGPTLTPTLTPTLSRQRQRE